MSQRRGSLFGPMWGLVLDVFHVRNTSTYSQDAPVHAFALHHPAERVGICRTVCASEEGLHGV